MTFFSLRQNDQSNMMDTNDADFNVQKIYKQFLQLDAVYFSLQSNSIMKVLVIHCLSCQHQKRHIAILLKVLSQAGAE